MSASWSRPTSSPKSICAITSANRRKHGRHSPDGLDDAAALAPCAISRLDRAAGAGAGGRPPGAAGLVLFPPNHVSYLDITVFGSLIPGSFIAKSEVAGWPLFGWLAKLQRSVFIDRQVRGTLQQRDTIAERLAARDVLILFP